jgi:stringent starvation protein B
MTESTSKRPYLIRAMHEWMMDNDLTPHIVVDAEAEGLTVPDQYIIDGKIVLNVSYAATRELAFDNDAVRFEARFSGVNHEVEVPALAVMGIYARETGQGMIFTDEEFLPNSEALGGGDTPARPALKIVK